MVDEGWDGVSHEHSAQQACEWRASPPLWCLVLSFPTPHTRDGWDGGGGGWGKRGWEWMDE